MIKREEMIDKQCYFEGINGIISFKKIKKIEEFMML